MAFGSLPNDQKRIALVSFVFCPVLIILTIPYLIVMNRLSSLDDGYVASLEIIVIGPIALCLSIWIYNKWIRSIVEDRDAK